MSGFRRTIGFVLTFIRPFRRHFVFVFLVTLFLQFLGLVAPFLSGRFVDQLVAKKPISALFLTALLMLLVALVSNGVRLVKDIREVRSLDFRLQESASALSLSRLFGFSLGQHVNEHSGLRQSVLARGESGIIALANILIYDIIPPVLQFFATTLALFYFSVALGIVASIFVAMYIIASVYMFRRFNAEVKMVRDASHDISKHQSEIMRLAGLVASNAQEKKIKEGHALRIASWRDMGERLWVAYCKILRTRDVIPPSMTAVFMVGGAYLVSLGTLSIGDTVVMIGWGQMMIGSLGSVGQTQRNLVQQYSAVERYVDMISITPAVSVVANPVLPSVKEGEIEFRDVHFSYPIVSTRSDDRPMEGVQGLSRGEEPERFIAISGCAFRVRAGTTSAIVGPSGSGKSTLIQLLLRGYDPDRGQVIVDGTDIRLFDLAEYRGHIGYVEQSVELFDDTLLANILFGISERDRDRAMGRLSDILKRSCLDGILPRLGKSGLETIIGEKGIRLSGGEKQRVGIARALIKDPKIILFDEATSNLDAESEAVIHHAMKETLSGRTGIIIAHRLSTIRDADQIIVLDGGAVSAVGKHEELMETSLVYANLVKRQIKSVEYLRLAS